jgi:hypothetical protein
MNEFPMFVQIATAMADGDTRLFGLDEEGKLWEYVFSQADDHGLAGWIKLKMRELPAAPAKREPR